MIKAWLTPLALVAAISAAPMGMAQTSPPAAPPTSSAPSPTSPTQTPPSTMPAPPRTSDGSAENDANCRTRKEAGAACACLSDPSRVGEAEAATDGGRNVCVIPAQ